MGSSPPLDRLTDKEINFVRSGDSLEIEAWNRDFALLVDEYQTALAEQDEGWASERVAEVRKCLEGLLRMDAPLLEAAGREVRDRRYADAEA